MMRIVEMVRNAATEKPVRANEPLTAAPTGMEGYMGCFLVERSSLRTDESRASDLLGARGYNQGLWMR